MSTEAAAPDRRIVVGIDGSASSRIALQWAALLAASTGAAIDAVISWDYPSGYGWSAIPDNWNPGQDAEKALTEIVDEVFATGRPADLRMITEEGSPAQVLLRHSAAAQLLVVGSRGHGGFVGLLIGSVSAYCAEHATCPVLVVHGDGPTALTGGATAG
jgi:nucleotide-binding universal stress UspA family protein